LATNISGWGLAGKIFRKPWRSYWNTLILKIGLPVSKNNQWLVLFNRCEKETMSWA
jgi:hypothetical protein